jgi:sugar phosphate permease
MRWVIIGMCFLGNAINYIDRANLAIAAPHIRVELGLDAAMMGLIMSAFFWSYAFCQMPAGWFIDKVGVRISLAAAVAWWSFFTGVTGLCHSFGQMIGSRFLLGVGESPAVPSFSKVAYNWFPHSERGIACSIFDSGSRVGSALSLPLIALIISYVGWRGSFIITGGIGLLWALVWWFVYKDPEKYRDIAPQQVEALLAERGTQVSDEVKQKVSWASLFHYRSVWGLMIGLFCLNFAIYFFITWFPSYLMETRGFSLQTLGTLGMVPALLAIPGGWLGGLTSDWLLKSGHTPTFARKTCVVGGMLLSSCIALCAVVDNIYVCLALFALSYASLSFAGSNTYVIAGEIAPTPGHVASIVGIMNFAGNLAGIFITTFTGVMLTLTQGSFLIPLVAAGSLCVVGALSYLFLVGKVEPLAIKE